LLADWSLGSTIGDQTVVAAHRNCSFGLCCLVEGTERAEIDSSISSIATPQILGQLLHWKINR